MSTALYSQVSRLDARRCSILDSEDLQHGQKLGDLVVVNPFLPQPSVVGCPTAG